MPGVDSVVETDIFVQPQTMSTVASDVQEQSQFKKISITPPNFKALLLAKAFDQAMVVYDEALVVDEITAAQFRNDILEYLRAGLASGDTSAVMGLIDLYLSRYYEDTDVLLLLAEFQWQQGYADEAARVFQQAFIYAYQPHQKQQVSDFFAAFVNTVDTSFSHQQRWLELQAFYELLLSIDLGGPSYDWRRANLYLQTGDKSLAREVLQQLQDEGYYPDETKELLLALQRDNSGDYLAPRQESIALVRRGNHYLVKVVLNNNVEATLMIDTGASVTSLSADSFTSLSEEVNLDYIGPRLFNTANGVTQGDVYSAASLSLGKQLLNDVGVAVLDFQSQTGVDGLLGMNVLKNFRFEIDQDNQQLLLSPR